MTSKKKRELIFNKYNGRCAYCGCELQKGWHIDELLPVRRNRKLLKAGFYHKITKEIKPAHHRAMLDSNYEYTDSRWVSDGCEHPERLHIDNQMPACPSCNINKHSLSLEEFRKLIEGFRKHLNEVSTQYKISKQYGLLIEVFTPVEFYFEKFE